MKTAGEASDAFDDQRVDHPQQRRRQCQHVASGREPEHEASVEDDQHHACERQRRTHGLPPRHPFAAVEQAQQYGRPYGRRADDQRNVRRRGVFQRHVFGQEIERAARDSGHRERQLVAPSRCPQPPAGQGPDADVGHGEPQQEYLRRGQRIGDEHLRRNERRSPYCHAEERRKVVFVLRIFYHTASKLQFFYLPDANLNSLFPIFNSFFLSLRAIMRNDNNYNR